MKLLNWLIALSLAITIYSCSSFNSASGTGHEGEARIVGVVYTAGGGVYRNGELFLAPDSYVPTALRNAPDTGVVLHTNGYGRVNVVIEPEVTYVLSGRLGTEILYEKLISSGDTVFANNLNYKVGKKYQVNNSNSNGDSFYDLVVPGTNWRFNLEGVNNSSVYLPWDDITVIRRGYAPVDSSVSDTTSDSTGSDTTSDPQATIADTIMLNSSIDTIGETVVTGDILSPQIDYMLSGDTILFTNELTLYINNYNRSNYYEINWGDTVETITYDSINHFYSPGEYTITLTMVDSLYSDSISYNETVVVLDTL